MIFSSPEPKAHGELIVYQSSRHLCVCPCVNIFKHEYLRNQWADCNQILSEASLGGERLQYVSGQIRLELWFPWPSSDSSHRVIMGKT